MKWTAYYTEKNYFANCTVRVYLGKSFKTKKELVHFLAVRGFAVVDHLIKNNQMANTQVTINLVKE